MDRNPIKTCSALALVLLAAAGAYLNTFNSPFLYDDYHTIVYNPFMQSLSNIPRFFASVSMHSGYESAFGGYRPLVTATLAVNYAISGLDTWSYHAFNILVHLASTAAVFLLARQMLSKAGLDGRFALVAAGVFGLHPAHTNAVTYIIARSALLCTLFYMLSFYAYLKWRASGGKKWLAASLASFALALLSKELAITLPLMFIIYEITARENRLKAAFKGTLAFIILAIIYAAAKHAVILYVGMEDIYQTPGSRLLTAPYALLGYLKIFLLPFNLDFMPDIAPPASLAAPGFYVPAVMLACIAAVLILLLRRNGFYAFCLAWFFIALLPETFANLADPLLEYRLYLPSAGLAVLVSLAAARVRLPVGGAVLAVALAILACFFILTHERNAVYADEVTLWRDTAGKSPRSAQVSGYLGEAYVRAKRYPEAIEAISKALATDPYMPNAPTAYLNLGMALSGIGNEEMAFRAYRAGLRLEPGNVDLNVALSSLSEKLGKQR